MEITTKTTTLLKKHIKQMPSTFEVRKINSAIQNNKVFGYVTDIDKLSYYLIEFCHDYYRVPKLEWKKSSDSCKAYASHSRGQKIKTFDTNLARDTFVNMMQELQVQGSTHIYY